MLVRRPRASPGRIIRSALSLLFSCAPFERANPSSDDSRRPSGLSDMPGGVPDLANWIAGATKSELERLNIWDTTCTPTGEETAQTNGNSWALMPKAGVTYGHAYPRTR